MAKLCTIHGWSTLARKLLPVALCAQVFLIGCQGDIEEAIHKANDFLYQKDYIKAERLYRSIAIKLGKGELAHERQHKQRLFVLEQLGKTNALYRHDYKQAINDLQQLIKLYPHSQEAMAARVSIADITQHKLGEIEGAIDEYQIIVLDFPNHDEARRAQLQIINAYFQLQNYKQARMEAQVLEKRWPQSSEATKARFQIANSFYIQGRYTEAIASYEEILQGPLTLTLRSIILFELGNCYQDMGESQRSLAYLYESLTEHPNPLLVQRKIKRARRRLRSTRPAGFIHSSSGSNSKIVMPGGKGPVGLSSRSLEWASRHPRRRRTPKDARQELLKVTQSAKRFKRRL